MESDQCSARFSCSGCPTETIQFLARWGAYLELLGKNCLGSPLRLLAECSPWSCWTEVSASLLSGGLPTHEAAHVPPHVYTLLLCIFRVQRCVKSIYPFIFPVSLTSSFALA